MSDDDEEMRYCVKCSDPEFDEDDKPTHDYEPYDHDFEPKEEGSSTQDVKDGLDIIGKSLDAWNKYKQAKQPAPNPKSLTNIPDVELHSKVDEIKQNIEKGKKIERKRWIIGIVIGGIIAVIVGIIQVFS